MASQDDKQRRKRLLHELAEKQRDDFENIFRTNNYWLSKHGGHCDCEVLANVEEHFN
jgi:hypothetical protein